MLTLSADKKILILQLYIKHNIFKFKKYNKI